MSASGFKFSLETPLKVKKIEKRRLEKELADALMRMTKEENKLKDLGHKEKNLALEIKQTITRGIDVNSLKGLDQYRRFLRKQVKVKKMEYSQAKAEYQKLQEDMVKLLNEIDVLDRLRKEKQREFLMELEKHEEKALEDNISYKTSVQGGRGYG